jgi:hypothetical protein
MKGKPYLKPLDIPVILLSLLLTIAAAAGVYALPQAHPEVTIRGPGRTWVFPLDAEETIKVPGAIGDTVVEIRGGAAAITASPCANQTCVAAGHLSRQGQWTACLPNNVFLLIEGKSIDAPDAASW